MVTLMNSDLLLLPRAVTLSRRTVRIIRENLFWAFGYNVVCIPVAAGVLYPVGLLLTPMWASASYGVQLGVGGAQQFAVTIRRINLKPNKDDTSKDFGQVRRLCSQDWRTVEYSFSRPISGVSICLLPINCLRSMPTYRRAGGRCRACGRLQSRITVREWRRPSPTRRGWHTTGCSGRGPMCGSRRRLKSPSWYDCVGWSDVQLCAKVHPSLGHRSLKSASLADQHRCSPQVVRAGRIGVCLQFIFVEYSSGYAFYPGAQRSMSIPTGLCGVPGDSTHCRVCEMERCPGRSVK